MTRLSPLLLLALFGCPGPEKPADTDPQDTDTAPAVECEDPSGPVTVVVTNDRGWYISDATVAWSTPDASGECEGESWDTWNCDVPAEGDLTITASHALHQAATQVLEATDGCRAGGESATFALTAAGTHFDTSRMYYQQLIEDPYECEHSWEIYGTSCYLTAAFCKDGYTAIMVTDILNSGVYDIGEEEISNTTMGIGDIPVEATFTIVSDTELVDWEDQTWHLDQDGFFDLYDCNE